MIFKSEYLSFQNKQFNSQMRETLKLQEQSIEIKSSMAPHDTQGKEY